MGAHGTIASVACIFMQATLYRERSHMPHRARLVRRDLAATAVPFARSIDGHLAHHSLQALTPLRLRRKGGITLSDGEGQGERAPTRLMGGKPTSGRTSSTATERGDRRGPHRRLDVRLCLMSGYVRGKAQGGRALP